jgi:hypothetical protein
MADSAGEEDEKRADGSVVKRKAGKGADLGEQEGKDALKKGRRGRTATRETRQNAKSRREEDGDAAVLMSGEHRYLEVTREKLRGTTGLRCFRVPIQLYIL